MERKTKTKTIAFALPSKRRPLSSSCSVLWILFLLECALKNLLCGIELKTGSDYSSGCYRCCAEE